MKPPSSTIEALFVVVVVVVVVPLGGRSQYQAGAWLLRTPLSSRAYCNGVHRHHHHCRRYVSSVPPLQQTPRRDITGRQWARYIRRRRRARWCLQSSPSDNDDSAASVAAAATHLSEDNDDDEENEIEIRNLSVRQLKAELAELKQPTDDAFEKEVLVQRLAKARRSQRQERCNAKNNGNGSSNNSDDGGGGSSTLRVPLYFVNMDRMNVAAVNMPNGGGITIEPSEQPYPAIQITIPNNNSGNLKGDKGTLTLLLDTACSGLVLRPEIASKYDLPSYSTPVTMTGAGGTVSGTGLTQLSKFYVGGVEFGPLPASVQDIGALPRQLDGIIGLSFLNQFDCVELNFRDGAATFYRDAAPALPKHGNNDNGTGGNIRVVGETGMRMLPQLGIYTVPVLLDGRGPVGLLVDTGAACSILSWKGVSDLGLSKSSNFIRPLRVPTGAMGSDNVAMALTHRLNVSSKLELGGDRSLPGLSLSGPSRRLSIDIGQIPLLENLQKDSVGGILGIDALMRCEAVRIYCRGGSAAKKIVLLDYEDDFTGTNNVETV